MPLKLLNLNILQIRDELGSKPLNQVMCVNHRYLRHLSRVKIGEKERTLKGLVLTK